MRADWIWMTHNGSGGAGSLTTVALTGWPTFGNVVNVARMVQYTILQFTDTTLTTLAQSETGRGTYTPGTGVLTRDVILRTWDGANYLPTNGSASAPTALDFSNTAGLVRISCSPTIETIPAIPFVATSFEGIGTFAANGVPALGATNSAELFAGGSVDYNAILIAHEGPFSMASVRVGDSSGTYSGGTQSLDVGIYEIGENGLPGTKLIDFGSLGGSSPFAAAATISSASLATPIYIEPGWYYQAILAQFTGGTGTPRGRGYYATLGAHPGGTRFSSAETVPVQLSLTGQSSLANPSPGGMTINNNGYFWMVAFK